MKELSASTTRSASVVGRGAAGSGAARRAAAHRAVRPRLRGERRRRGLADFDDLLIWARDLLRDNLEVRRYFQRRFARAADRRVPGHRPDPGRDRDPAWRATGRTRATGASSTPAPGKLFVVGDPKQSIYRFRRADIAIYDEVKRGPLGGRAA